VQLLAAGVIAGSHSLDRGHIGRICDALTESGLDLEAWTAKALLDALSADMKARGWSWPDRVDHPSSFLRSRLQRLPVRPPGAPPGGVTAARPGSRKPAAVQDSVNESRKTAQERTQRWYADVTAVTTTTQDRQALLRAHEAKFGPAVDPFAAIANAGRLAARLFPELPLNAALTRWVSDVLGGEADAVAAEQVPVSRSLSADLLIDLAIGNCDCMVCGSRRATERPQLPMKSMVCDQCWPVIAAELAEASDIDEGMLA
jgi:hypothetical protein